MERTGIEPVTSGLQTQPIARPHLTPTDRIGMTEPYSAICRTSPDTVRRRSARTALARPVPTWATIVRSRRTRARRSGEGGDRPPLYHGTSQATSRYRRQRFWLVLGPPRLGRFAVDCHRLQPRGSIEAPYVVASLGYAIALRARDVRACSASHARCLYSSLRRIQVWNASPSSRPFGVRSRIG
jgi:hypothetical protein